MEQTQHPLDEQASLLDCDGDGETCTLRLTKAEFEQQTECFKNATTEQIVAWIEETTEQLDWDASLENGVSTPPALTLGVIEHHLFYHWFDLGYLHVIEDLEGSNMAELIPLCQTPYDWLHEHKHIFTFGASLTAD